MKICVGLLMVFAMNFCAGNGFDVYHSSFDDSELSRSSLPFISISTFKTGLHQRLRRFARKKPHPKHPEIPSTLIGSRTLLCSTHCATSMVRTLGSEFKEAANGMINPVMFDKKNFQFFCGQYQKAVQCLNRCHKTSTDPTTANLMDHLFKSVKYLCVDHKKGFLKNIGCFAETHAEIAEVCDGKCGNISTLDKLENAQEKLEKEIRLFGMKQKLKETCQYIDCHVSCSSPIVDKTCKTEEPSEFFEDFITSVFSDSAMEFKKLELENFWPDKCKEIAQGKFAVTKQQQAELAKLEEAIEEALVDGVVEIANDAMESDDKSRPLAANNCQTSVICSAQVTIVLFGIRFIVKNLIGFL